MEKVPGDERTEVMGDKGYKSKKNDRLLEEMGSNTIYTLKLLIENLVPKLFSSRVNT